MGFICPMSLVFGHFGLFNSVLSLALKFYACLVVYIVTLFLLDFIYISSHLFLLGFNLFVGTEDFWAMGLNFFTLSGIGGELSIGTVVNP